MVCILTGLVSLFFYCVGLIGAINKKTHPQSWVIGIWILGFISIISLSVCSAYFGNYHGLGRPRPLSQISEISGTAVPSTLTFDENNKLFENMLILDDKTKKPIYVQIPFNLIHYGPKNTNGQLDKITFVPAHSKIINYPDKVTINPKPYP
jgi:hypothetical protein